MAGLEKGTPLVENMLGEDSVRLEQLNTAEVKVDDRELAGDETWERG